MYTCVSEGYEGYPCDKQQEGNRDIFAWHTPEIDFPTFMWGLFRPWGEREQEFGLSLSLCWFSSCSSGGPDWATETEEAGKEENKKWEWGRQKSEALKFQIRLLYSDAGGEWFQAADNGPTESILTFSLVIAEFAGWGQWLDLC